MKPTSKDERPVNLDISTIRLPLAAYASITHRISGVILFVGIGILLWMLDKSLSGPAGFGELQDRLNPVVRGIDLRIVVIRCTNITSFGRSGPEANSW